MMNINANQFATAPVQGKYSTGVLMNDNHQLENPWNLKNSQIFHNNVELQQNWLFCF